MSQTLSGPIAKTAAGKAVFPAADDNNNLKMASASSSPAVVTLTAGTAYNFTSFGSVGVQVDGISGGDAITVSASSTQNGTYYAMPLLVLSGTTVGGSAATITAAGLYSVFGGGNKWIKVAKTGTASTPTVTLTGAQ